MSRTCRKYIKLLRVELEDLEEHVEEQILANRERYARREESEYVCLENVAVLGNEECGVRRCCELLERIDADQYENVEALVEDLKTRFRARVRECGLEPLANVFIEPKLDRLKAYVAHEQQALRETGKSMALHEPRPQPGKA